MTRFYAPLRYICRSLLHSNGTAAEESSDELDSCRLRLHPMGIPRCRRQRWHLSSNRGRSKGARRYEVNVGHSRIDLCLNSGKGHEAVESSPTTSGSRYQDYFSRSLIFAHAQVVYDVNIVRYDMHVLYTATSPFHGYRLDPLWLFRISQVSCYRGEGSEPPKVHNRLVISEHVQPDLRAKFITTFWLMGSRAEVQ